MRRRILRWLVAGVVLAAVVIAVVHATRPEPVEVVVRPVERGRVDRTVANTRAGTVMACRRARLSPSVGGQIAKLPVREGDRVKAGQLLLELWNDDLVAQADLAQKEAVSARARAKAVCLKADVTQREADRLVKLLRSGAVSEERVDKVVTEAKSLRADCAAARASVSMSAARVEVARANLARTRLAAPFDGVVAEINGELFEYVTPSPVGIATPPAIDIIDNSCFYVTAPIDEVDAADIVVGLPARITLDAFAARRFEGRVRRIAAYVMDYEKQARTVDVEVAFVHPEEIQPLLAGYSADIEIVLDVRPDTLRIPTEAIMDARNVFAFSPQTNMLEARAIVTGLSNWDYTEVVSGLEPGERIVINVDRAGLEDGAAAVVIEENP